MGLMVRSPAQPYRVRTLIHPGPVPGGHVISISTENSTLNGTYCTSKEGKSVKLIDSQFKYLLRAVDPLLHSGIYYVDV
ncbi:MAG: hypothetical protein EBZ48_11080 [Proteobacteria bacterium]|nr:hypothetical protein [Pseudomonadota bacterium]